MYSYHLQWHLESLCKLQQNYHLNQAVLLGQYL